MDKTMRNARLLTILFIVMTVVITAGSFGYLNFLARQAVGDSVRGNLESTAIVIASEINGDTFATMRPGDESLPSFIVLRDTLHRIEKADQGFRYIYTMRQNGSVVEFVVDGDYGIAPDAARIGDAYPDASPAMLSGFTAPSAELQLSSDQWGTVLSGYAPIRDHEGSVVGIVGVDKDSQIVAQEMDRIKTVNYAFLSIIIALFALGAIIFDVRRSRVETITQQANRKLNQLNSIIRHDIFNTLTGLSGYVEMAQESRTPEEIRDKLGTIAKLTDKIQQQVAFTRDYQDLGLNMPRWQEVSEIVKNVIAGVDLFPVAPDFDFNGLQIYADPLLDRVFLHLFENSRNRGDSVTRIRGYFLQSGATVTIIIEDNGNGIPAEMKEAIFTRKAFRDDDLGFFLVREILALTGISICETGLPGQGSRFEIRVPKKMARIHSTEAGKNGS